MLRAGAPELQLDLKGLNPLAAMQATMAEMGFDPEESWEETAADEEEEGETAGGVATGAAGGVATGAAGGGEAVEAASAFVGAKASGGQCAALEVAAITAASRDGEDSLQPCHPCVDMSVGERTSERRGTKERPPRARLLMRARTSVTC